MKKQIPFVTLLIVLSIPFCFGQSVSTGDTAFSGVKLADAKGKQTDARLIFSDTNKTLVVKVADREIVNVPYEQLDKFSSGSSPLMRFTVGGPPSGSPALFGRVPPRGHRLWPDRIMGARSDCSVRPSNTCGVLSTTLLTTFPEPR